MSIKLKKIEDQVIVITGASSGIGLCTAESAAHQGAKVVLAARSGATLDEIVSRINAAGGEAHSVVCDVADRAQVDRLAQEAINRFGRFDTWVNNAGIAIYGRLEQVTEEDSRRLFDINFWGVVNGSLAALPQLRAHGGALINVGSEVSEAYAPILGMYSASKHAVKGFTDALRVEVEYVDKAPVSITLIQPTAVDTPFDEHGRNYMDKAADLPTPQVDPQDVANAILKSAEKPQRWVKVGVNAVVNSFFSKNFPSVADRMSARMVKDVQRDEPNTNPDGAFYRASEDGQTHGNHAGA